MYLVQDFLSCSESLAFKFRPFKDVSRTIPTEANMAHIIFEQAHREAQQKLDDVEERIANLHREKEALQGLVVSLGDYLSVADVTLLSGEMDLDEQASARRGTLTQPAWSLARDILASKGSPMTVPEIHKIMSNLGFTSKPDAIRIAMIRKPDIFNNHGNGAYGLVTQRHVGPPPSSDEDDEDPFADAPIVQELRPKTRDTSVW